MHRVKQDVTSNYEFFQPNPSWKGKGRYLHEDCPIRAICAAEQLDWNTVYDLLCECGKNVFDAPTSDDSIALCLKRLSYTKYSVKVTKGSKRPTVANFAKEHPQGTYVVRVADMWSVSKMVSTLTTGTVVISVFIQYMKKILSNL